MRRHGCDLAFTQMLNAKSVISSEKSRAEYIDWDDYSTSNGNVHLEDEARSLDRNIIIQLAGSDIGAMVEAGVR